MKIFLKNQLETSNSNKGGRKYIQKAKKCKKSEKLLSIQEESGSSESLSNRNKQFLNDKSGDSIANSADNNIVSSSLDFLGSNH